MDASRIFCCYIADWAGLWEAASLHLRPPRGGHIFLHVTIASARKLFFTSLISSWNNIGPLGFISNFYGSGERPAMKKTSIFLNQKSSYIVTLEDRWSNPYPSILFLSLWRCFPSSFKIVISHLFIVPVFPLWSHQLLEDKHYGHFNLLMVHKEVV